MEGSVYAMGRVVGRSVRRRDDHGDAGAHVLGRHHPVHERGQVTRAARITLLAQITGFALYGLIVGEAFAYRIEKERQLTIDIIMAAPVNALSNVSTKEKDT